jgi:hypothetical protein
MTTTIRDKISLRATVKSWWRTESDRVGAWRTLRLFASSLGQFLRDSTPSRKRQRYGDVDFDWDYRVDTTGATVGWRDRFLGMFHSAYQPTDPGIFHEMLAGLRIDFDRFTFIDVGSGKGRVLLMAANYPFQRILGIELFPALHRIATDNIRKYKSDTQKCFALESMCADARLFEFPPDPILLYLFNPLPEAGLKDLLKNLERSVNQHPRPVFVLYSNPLLENLFSEGTCFKKIAGTHQYSVYEMTGR